jgi:hypothetical protein
VEQYVYYSIIFFVGLISLLYIYILLEKSISFYGQKNREKSEKTLLPYIDSIFLSMEEEYPNYIIIKKVKEKIKNPMNRKIVIERVIYFVSIFSGQIRLSIIRFCEDTELLSYVLKSLKSKDYKKVALSCKILGEFGSESSVLDLLKVLDKKIPDIQYNALMALSKIGDMESLVTAFATLNENNTLSERSLIEIVDSFNGDKISLYHKMIFDEDPFISSIFIKSSGNYMDFALNDIIASFIKEINLTRKIASIKVIGQTYDIRYIDDLIECMKDDSWQVRAIAASSLGKLESGSSLPILIGALNDKEWWVRRNSAQAIFMIPHGVKEIEAVFLAQDSFAKDSILSAMEDSGAFSELYLYQYSTDISKRHLAKLINDYINKVEVGDFKNGV